MELPQVSEWVTGEKLQNWRHLCSVQGRTKDEPLGWHELATSQRRLESLSCFSEPRWEAEVVSWVLFALCLGHCSCICASGSLLGEFGKPSDKPTSSSWLYAVCRSHLQRSL